MDIEAEVAVEAVVVDLVAEEEAVVVAVAAEVFVVVVRFVDLSISKIIIGIGLIFKN